VLNQPGNSLYNAVVSALNVRFVAAGKEPFVSRLVGVILSAILSLLGSLLVLGMAAAMGFALMFAPVSGTRDVPGPVFLKAVLAGMVVFYLLLASWGVLTAIGLFRLRNWARISIIVFSVLLIPIGLCSGLVGLLMPFPPPPNAAASNIFTAVRIGMGVFFLSLAAIGIAWLVYFNRAKVKLQFVSARQLVSAGPVNVLPVAQFPAPAPPAAPGRPLSITIIAWFLLVSCAFLPLTIILRPPALVGAWIVTGSAAVAICCIYGVLNLYIGIGLLRLRPAARIMAIAVFSIGILNTLTFVLAPGLRARVDTLLSWQWKFMGASNAWLSSSRYTINMVPMMIPGLIMGVIVSGVVIYFLVASKQAFERS
jgi:hypothetical protein